MISDSVISLADIERQLFHCNPFGLVRHIFTRLDYHTKKPVAAQLHVIG